MGSIFSDKPRSFFGIHSQKQEGKYFAGIHVPVGRLLAEDLQDLANICENFGDKEINLPKTKILLLLV